MISLSGCMAGGITMVIRWDTSSALRLHHTIFRDKFSASNYWKDCVKYKVCRLVSTESKLCAPIPRWQQHNTLERSAATWSTLPPARKKTAIKSGWCLATVWGPTFGPSLSPGDSSVWLQFTFLSRFGIQDISEFYGSTEGNSNILNFDNTVGAVGFVPVLFSSILPLGPIKVLQWLAIRSIERTL